MIKKYLYRVILAVISMIGYDATAFATSIDNGIVEKTTFILMENCGDFPYVELPNAFLRDEPEKNVKPSREINEEGVVGKMFLPNTSEPRPAVIVFSGSDGGFNERQAQLFAQEGYVALALAFFDADSLPKNLENIPLEYFLNGMRWLKSQREVKSQQIHLYGPSRGGELVLLLASTFPDEMTSIIAVVPSCVTFGGLPNEKTASWTLSGNSLPFAPTPGREDVYRQLESRTTVRLVDLFLEKMQDKSAFNSAFIEVEKIRSPILLISGKDDKMWPSSIYCDLILERLDKFQSPILRRHLCYENAGHMIGNPFIAPMTAPFLHPVTGLSYELGGSPEAQKIANEESWKEILAFLKRHSQ